MLHKKTYKLKCLRMIGLVSIVALGLITIVGSGGGGGGGDAPPPTGGGSGVAVIQVSPSDYNFGDVTPGNSAPLNITIRNTGSATLSVSSMVLSETTNFALTPDSGDNSCGLTNPNIGVGDSCTVEVAFQPDIGAIFDDTYTATLTINSNASNTPSAVVGPLSGKYIQVDDIIVRINQVISDESCPGPPGPSVTAFVSVTDQVGYPVVNLAKDDFTISEDGAPIPPANFTDFTWISQVNDPPISIGLVMDYSSSISTDYQLMRSMENAIIDFVDQMVGLDEAEIIKFALNIVIMTPAAEPFTSDKDILNSAIRAPYPGAGAETKLYDAVYQAVEDIDTQSTNPSYYRKAVIVITDGKNNSGFYDIEDTKAYALEKGVPVFTIGLGGDVDGPALTDLADSTGGQYYASPTIDSLKTVYQQLAETLLINQYILTYTSGLAAQGELAIQATYPGPIVGSNTKTIEPCP